MFVYNMIDVVWLLCNMLYIVSLEKGFGFGYLLGCWFDGELIIGVLCVFGC